MTRATTHSCASTALKLAAMGLFGASIGLSAPIWASEITKSESDLRNYRALVLDNGMQVVLVSDPTTDKASASLSVDIGSGANPPDRAGLAHFLEHMLFLGTEKYPEPGEYKDFISRHGGSDNAYTAFDETNYFFEIEAGFLEAGMDRFAQFFIAPRFNPEYVERERQVVHSEYLGQRTNDHRRSYAAAQQVMNPAHPSAGFSVGNLQTLADRPGSNIRDELLAFYERYYSANLMALSVVGRESLEVLEQWVRASFSQVRNNNAEGLRVDVPLYLPGALPAQLDVIPERESFSLAFTFPIASVREYWRAKPAAHVSHLLGHEGDTSLLAELKKRGWAQGLSAGASDHENSAALSVNIQLTPTGAKHTDDIAKLLFQTIAIIKRDGVQRWLFDENARLATIDFKYSEKPSPSALARRLASAQHEFPQHQLLRAAYAYDEWRPDLIKQLLNAMRPDNVLVTRVIPGLDTDRKATWYDTPFRISKLAPATVEAWAAVGANDLADSDTALAIPAKNPFIPKLLLMRAGTKTGIPRILESKPGYQLWHAQQDEFALPKADFFVSLRSPIANDTPSHSLLTSLYIRLVNDQLDAFAYAADLAGLSFSLYTHSRGLSLRISGYDDRQAVLLKRILKVLVAVKIDPQRFSIMKEETKRGLENARRDQPYRRAMAHLREVLVQHNWTQAEHLSVIDALSAPQLEQFIPRLLSSVDVVALSHGNLDAAGASDMGKMVYDTVVAPAKNITVDRARVLKLKRGDRLAMDIHAQHPESALVAYLQAADKSVVSRAQSALAAQILSSPFFDVLRTEKKLGYVVFANAYPVLDSAAMVFIVQSPVADALSLQHEVDAFLAGYEPQLAKTSGAEFEQHKAALIAQVMEAEPQLSERSSRFWNEIDRGNFAFDSRDKLTRAIRDLSFDAFQTFYRQVLVGKDRRAVTMRVHGRATPTATTTIPAHEQAVTAAWARSNRIFMD
ncbi:MAG: insulysin [Gammaproteobacteria bacterium]|jgi:insulysin